MAIPPHLILDPLAPIPAKMSKKDIARLQDLREAYAESMRKHMAGESLGSPDAAAAIFQPVLAGLQVESLAVVALNPRMRPMGPPVIVTRGDTDGVDAPLRAILRAVLVQEGTSWLVAHNHPSGDPSPSQGDIAVTQKLVAGGRAIECPLQDHVIIGRGSWVSLRRDMPHLWR